MATSLEQILNKSQTRATMKPTQDKYEQIFYSTDHHYPHTSREMAKVELSVLAEEKPKYHVLGGDWIDASGLSSFEPNAKYIDETQNEIDGFVHYLARLHEASPETKRIMIYGNHDWARLERAKAESPFGLAGMRVLNFETLFKEAAKHYELDIGELEFTKEWMLGRGLKFVHGDNRMDKKLKGGVTGIRRTVTEYPGDYHLIIGHGHRRQMGVHPWRKREVHMVGAMMDCDDVGYDTFSQYENGVAMIHYSPNSRPDPIYHIENAKKQDNGDVVLNGKVFNGRR